LGGPLVAPPATFSDWRYLTVAAVGSLVAFVSGRRLDQLARPIVVLDAIPALVGAFLVVAADRLGMADLSAAITGALICFAIRMVGVRFDIDAPAPPGTSRGA
jgi:uncharacterized membrane protein YeiH